MKPASSDAIGTIRATLNTQSGNHHDARQDPDAGRSQSTQQSAPTVSVDNDRQTIALPAQFPPPQQELTNQFVPAAPPGQLSASQPVLRGLESTESVHGSGIGQTHVPGSLAPQALGLTSCEQAVMITGGSSLEQGSDPGMVQATSDQRYRSELSEWVESAAPAGRAAHQEVQKRINSHLTNPAKRRNSLNLSDLNLTNLPPLPSDLEALYLNGNKLTALPKHLPQNLRVLDVHGNKLTALPEDLPKGLRKLDVAGNKLTALPEDLPQGLQKLDVERNKLTALPAHLPQGLWKLLVGFNKLTALPEKLPLGLLKLHADTNKLTALPAHLPEGLVELHVVSNSLSSLPKNLPQGLQELDVSCNKLSALPEYLPPGLRKLKVSGNRLIVLPEDLPQGLLELHAAETGLSSLPKNLPLGLQELDVSCNKLSALPEYLPQGLRKLLVGSNKLTALPKNLPQNLKYLSVGGNGFNSQTLVALMRSNTSIKNQIINRNDIDDDSMEVLQAEQINNREHPARLKKAAVTLDLLTRFGLATSDQSGALIKRTSTPTPTVNRLPGQPIPAELHDVLAANCPKDVLAILAGMVDGSAQ